MGYLIKGRIETGGVREQAVGNNIWSQEGRRNKTQNGSTYVIRNIMICTPISRPILLERSDQRYGMVGTCGMHEGGGEILLTFGTQSEKIIAL